MKIVHLISAVFAIALQQTASAQEMPGRVYSGEPSALAPKLRVAPQKLQPLSVPVFAVNLAPTKQQLDEVAASALPGKNAKLSVAEKIGVGKSAAQPGTVRPTRVGSVFASDMKRSALAWQTAADRSSVTQLVVTSAGAKGIRAQIHLPEGMSNGEIRVAADREQTPEILPLSVAQDGVIWTPYTEGPMQIIEIFTRQAVAGTMLSVGDVMHFEQSLSAAVAEGPAKASGACNPDVACTSANSAVDAAINDRKQSVAKINFRSGAGAFICTGTLLNSQAFPVPYFLTANHCISTAAEAASVSTQWFRYASACGTGANAGASEVQIGGGAQLVFTNHMADATLLQLNVSPPQGTVFSGWNAAPLANATSIISVSHPAGDVMKFALGTISAPNSTSGQLRLFGYPLDMYGVAFTRGVIEGGSSGSGLYTLAADGSLQLRGVLSGSTIANSPNGLSCTNLNETATYGRFDVFYYQIEPYLAARSYPVDDHANQPIDSAAAIALNGAAVGATLGRAGDLDVFKIDVATAGTLTVGSRGGNDLIGTLLDANGAPFEPTGYASNDDAEQGNNEFGMTVGVTPGRYYLSVGHFEPQATTPNGYQVFAKFTTATENYTNMWWIESESGWGFNVNHQDNTIFGTLYTYDTNNRATWLALSNGARQPDGSYSGDLFRVRGPAFNAVPFAGVTPTRVGNMRVTFSGAAGPAQTATITYDISGVVVTKTMKRLEFATPFPVCRFSGFDRSAASNYTDIWWNPSESGWGLTLANQGDVLFGTLYTYDRTGQDIWLSMSRGERRLTANSVIFEGVLYRATGNAFNRPPYTLISATAVGNMKLEFPFNNSNAAKLTYDFDGSTVTKDIQRTVFGEARTACSRF